MSIYRLTAGVEWSRRLIVCASLILLAGCGKKDAVETIWLGDVAALSGSAKGESERARQGILLAVEAANGAEDKVLGRKVAFDHGDTRSQPDMVRSVVIRLVTVNRVKALMGGVETANIEGVATIAQGNNVPFVLAAPSPARGGGEYVFYTGLAPAWHGQALGRYAAQDLKADTIALFSDGQSQREVLLDAFVREVPREAVLGRWSYASADKMKATVAEMLERKPAIIVFAGSPADFGAFISQGIDSKMPIIYAGDEASLRTLHGIRASSPLYLATPFADDGKSEQAKEFAKKYQERFGEPPDAIAALAYDNTRLLVEALRHGKSLEGPKIREALKELKFTGLTGVMAFDAQQSLPRPAFILKLQSGKASFQKRYDPPEKADAK